MRLIVVGVGRSSKGSERELTERYQKRIPALARAHGFSGLDLHQLSESRKDSADARKSEEARAIELKVGAGLIVALDERGDNLTSADFAALLQKMRSECSGDMHFILGGPDGLDAALRARAHKTLALGTMTWPHQLALAMLMEQIYRGLTLLSGHPYHRI